MKFKFHLLFLMISVISQAQTFQLEGIFFSGPVFTVNSYNNQIYVGAGSAIEIFELQPGQQPILIGKAHTIDVVSSICIHENVVYTGNNGIGFSIFDVFNPSEPQLTSIIYDSIIAGHHPPVIDHNYLFISAGSYGVIVMDISSPLQPVEVCRWKTPDFILSIKKLGTTVFAADRTYGIILLNFDGTTLIPFDTINPFPNCAWYSFFIDESTQLLWLYCYGSNIPYNNNVHVAVISLQQNNYLQVLSTFSFPSRPIASLSVTNNKAYMACWEQGLKIFDVTNLQSPQHIYTIPTQSYSLWTHLINDSILAVAQYSEGLWLIDISQSFFPIASITDHYGDIKSVATSDSSLYTIKLTEGISTIRHSQNNKFIEYNLPFISSPNAQDITIKDNLLYIAADNDGLFAFNLNNNPPTQIWHYNTSGAIATYVKDTLLFCVRSYYNFLQRPVELQIFNIKNSSQPFLLSSVQVITQSWPQDRPLIHIDCYDTLLAISCWNDALTGSIHIFSISNPYQPQIIYQMLNTRIAQTQFLTRNGNIYLAATWGTSLLGQANGLKIFKWLNNELVQISEYITGSLGNRAVGVACSNDYCFIAEGGLSAHGHIYMLKIEQSMNLTLNQKIKIGSNTNHHNLKIWKNYLLHAAGSPSFMIFIIDDPLQIIYPIIWQYSSILIYPNPSSDFINTKMIWKNLKIFDINGNLVSEYNNFTQDIPVNHLSNGSYLVIIDNKYATKFLKY